MPSPDSEFVDALSAFGTCILADALDRLGFQMHNRGFARPGLQCFSHECGAVAGYATTARVRASDPPITGRSYFRHTDWWAEIQRLPAPRIVVLEDIDRRPGEGACIGQLGAALFGVLDCVGAVTNGSVRDIPEVAAMGFALFAAHTSPSRAYAHVVDHSAPVEILGLRVSPGDLLVADRHGVLSIPPETRPGLIETATEIRRGKREFVEFCRSEQFSIEGMESQLGKFQL